MARFERYECETCGERFAAHPSARAAEQGYCSPACYHSPGE
jgi:formylmethanofuran dehydrogenase subunit E